MKLIQLIIIALLVASLLSCNRNGNKADGYGNFEATETTISAEANGKLLTFNVVEGNILDKNQIVGIIDTIQLSLMRAQLLATKNTVFSKSRNVLSQREVLKEQLNVAQNNQTRIENLVNANAATTKQLDDINGEISIIRERMKSIESQNAPIVNEVKSIEVQVRQIEDQIEKSIVRNPVRGTVLVKYAEPNEVTAFGRPLYKIADLEEMILRVYISENQLARLEVGQTVTVKIDDEKEMKSYQGQISWISDSAEFTPKIIQTREERVNLVYAVKIRVKNDGGLKIGMPAEMWLSNSE